MGNDNQTTDAINQASQRYPWLKRFGGRIAVTQGTGGGQSESYMPNAPDNPKPGNYTVQLRKALKNPASWPALLGRESIDWLARSDPAYQAVQRAFISSMSQEQLEDAKRAYQRDLKEFPGGVGSFDDWMREAQAQEYIGAYLVPEIAPEWTAPNGEGKYTPAQRQMLDRLKQHLYQGQ